MKGVSSGLFPALVHTRLTAPEEHYCKEPRLRATVSCSFGATKLRKDGGIVVVGILSASHKVKC